MDHNLWTKEDKVYIEEFFCNRTLVDFRESYFWDAAYGSVYTEKVTFKLKCSLSPIINSKVRILWETPVRDPNYTAVYTNTVDNEGRQPKNFNKSMLRTVTFLKQSNYYAQIVASFDK